MIAEICNMNIKKHNGTESFFYPVYIWVVILVD